MSEAAPAGKPSELTVRVLTGIALVAVALTALVLGGFVFWLLLSIGGLLMMAEWADLQKAKPHWKRLAMFALSVPLAILCPLAAGPGFFALGLIVGAAFFVVIVSRLPDLALGVVYVGLPVLSLIILREHSQYGLIYAIWCMALVWATDIGAYFAGRAIGGPKLAPKLSPKKTWAGLAGGVVLASLFAAFMHKQYGLALRLTVATPVLAVIAQGGDLYESWLKRKAGVKDSGNLLPGHGGVLDRLDGLVPVAPVAAFVSVMTGWHPW